MVKGFRLLVLASTFAFSGVTAASELPPLPETSTGSAPIWVNDPRLQFPRVDYLSRRGKGESAEAAVQTAYDKLLELYHVKEGETLPEAITSAIQIPGVWHDSANNQYRALITLKQKAAENYLRGKIKELDSATEEAVKSANTDPEPIIKLRMTAKALQYQTERAAFQKSMKRVDVTARGIPGKWDVKQLEQDLEGYITGMTIKPAGDASDVQLDYMSNMITRGLKVAGIKAAEQADYILKGRLTISHAPDESGWMGGQGTLEVDLVKPSSDEPIGSYQWDINVIHLYPETAERRVVEKAEYLLKKEMRDVIIAIALQ